MHTLIACLRLARTDSIGPTRWRQLMARYHTPQAALDALPSLRPKGRPAVTPPPVVDIEQEIDATYRLGGQFVTLLDDAYPLLLRNCPDAPPVLSVLGQVNCLHQAGVSVVGARNASAHGIRFAGALATELVESGLSVISGLARGIDRAAHMGALHRQGLTIAAIAGGLDRPYPPENATLQAEIAERGVVVTEAPLGTIPTNRHFPRRNRLIAGLGLGCVVVEAAPHSGTLITARLAAEYGREVFAVPGTPLEPRYRGSNNLLRTGAILTESVADILPHLPPMPKSDSFSLKTPTPQKKDGQPQLWAELPPATAPTPTTPKPTASLAKTVHTPPFTPGTKPPPPAPHAAPQQPEKLHENLLDLLSFTPIPVDELVRHCQFSASAVLTVLTELELAGRVSLLPGGRVILTAPDQ
ncbi:DNA polymerase III [Acetobacter orientalis]|uniref:DNA-processing protein DprA n=1 Tax=Acetobacter orientalis TaxID=146474 RepID=UPI000A36FA70|nr:DNA-processing protein DprA [Acetobacter orientalis]OUJ15526.1 DNA polymerase III [Acetobacter orientalis]